MTGVRTRILQTTDDIVHTESPTMVTDLLDDVRSESIGPFIVMQSAQ